MFSREELDDRARLFFFAIRRRHTRCSRDWSSDVCSSDLASMPGMPYTLFTAGTASVSGVMDLPEEARKLGMRPGWLGYVGVNDVDAAADRIKRLGGALYVPPTDVPNI